MDEKVKIALSGFCGALAALAENYGVILTLCCTFILIDLVTGLAKAKIQGQINSDTGYKASGARQPCWRPGTPRPAGAPMSLWTTPRCAM